MNPTLQEAGSSFKFGTVESIDAAACRVRVCLPDLDNLRTAWLPVLQAKTLRDKHYRLPDLGEHVVVLLDAHGEDGVVLGAIYSSADAPPASSADVHQIRFADGAQIEYDRAKHQLTVQGGVEKLVVQTTASVELKAATAVTIDAPSTTVTGNLLVKGQLTYQGGMAGSGGSGGAAAAITGNLTITGGDVTVQGKRFLPHTHPVPQGGNTGAVN